jgi:NDP-sugar pyrophosphorylase family protein
MRYIIVTGGRGMRCAGAGDIPKHLLWVHDRPILGHIALLLSQCNAHHVTVIVGTGARQIKDYLATLASPQWTFYHDHLLPGCWWPVLLELAAISPDQDERIVIWVGDTVVRCDPSDLSAAFGDQRPFTAIAFRNMVTTAPRGEFLFSGAKLEGYREGLIPANAWSNVGLYSTTPRLLQNYANQFPERILFPKLLLDGKLGVQKVEGTAVNINTLSDLAIASAALSKAS